MRQLVAQLVDHSPTNLLALMPAWLLLPSGRSHSVSLGMKLNSECV